MESEIFINQLGYRPQDIKTVFISAKQKGKEEYFSLYKTGNKSGIDTVAFKSALVSAPSDTESGEPYFTGDFSSVLKKGDYYICVGDKKSFTFKISDNPYKEVFLSMLKYFTESRCGQGICHTGIAEIYGTSETKNVQGGWHDAGDYGRYVVAGTKAVMDLLLAYKKCPKFFNDFALLDEVRFELEWLLQMQREDGAVYHKISCYNFCGFVMPQEETDPLVLAPVSTAATADFAGCLAYASGFYKSVDSDFSKKLLQAALKAQAYLFSHDDEYFINPPEITTGMYGDKDVSDERYFALCSLFAATGEKNYLKQALKYFESKKSIVGFSWPFVSGYGTEILLENENLLAKETVKEIKASILFQANTNMEISRASAFNVCTKAIGWGSNGALCDLAHVLMMAYDLTGRNEFFEAAKAQIDYILGCNPLNYCYITGSGTKSPLHPHHRPSGASDRVLEGMLAGGPCSGLYDEYAKKHLTGLAPLKCYADAQPSYSTNEVAIYWNSSFIYLLSRIM